MSQPDAGDQQLLPSEPRFYSQPWPDKTTFAGMELSGVGGTVEHDTSYEIELEIGRNRVIVRLDYNSNSSREEDGTNVLVVPAGFALDIKIGGGGDQINPSVCAFRATDLGGGKTNIYVQRVPLDGTLGLTYSMDAINGILTSATLDEGSRRTFDEEVAAPVNSPATFIEEPIYDAQGNFQYNQVSIVDERMISLLEKLGLPTTWKNMQNRGEGNLEQTTVEPFPELLNRFEDLVRSLQSRGPGALLKLTE